MALTKISGDIIQDNVVIAGILTATNLKSQQLSVTGISTVGSLSIGNTSVISSGRQLQNIASLDATTTATIESAVANAPNTFSDLNVSGISTLGVTSATNLTAQQLNVSGISTLGIATASSLVVSGVTTVSAGSTALPSITPSGDSNTGIFFPAADTIGASTGGTARITIDSSGNITVTNNLIIPLGTAALPSLAILSDPNTGIFSPGADQLAISTNGTSRLLIDASGNIANTRAVATAYSGTNAATWINGLTITNVSTPALGIANLIAFQGAANVNAAFGVTQNGSTYGDFVWASYNGSFSERMRLTSAGFLGIGTTSPASPLQISNASDAVVDVTNTGTGLTRTRYNTSTRYFHVGINDGAGSGFAGAGAYSAVVWNTAATPLVFATDNTQRAQIDASGRLLVGTTTALGNIQYLGTNYTPKLQVQGTNQTNSFASLIRTDGFTPVLFLGAGSNGNNPPINRTIGAIAFNSFDGTNYIHTAIIEAAVDGTPGANDMPGRLVFSTTPDGGSSPTARMTIKENGRVGINTITPSTTLEVNGTVTATAFSGAVSLTDVASTGTNLTIVNATPQRTIASISLTSGVWLVTGTWSGSYATGLGTVSTAQKFGLNTAASFGTVNYNNDSIVSPVNTYVCAQSSLCFIATVASTETWYLYGGPASISSSLVCVLSGTIRAVKLS